MSRLRQDLRYAFRVLIRDPWFSLAVTAILALGIALVTLVYSVVHGVLLEPLPFPDADRLVMVWQTEPVHHADEAASYPDLRDFQSEARSFAGLAGFQTDSRNLGGADQHPIRVTAAAVSHNLFDVLRVDPLLGRTFQEDEDRGGAAPVVMISEELWRGRYAASPNVLGKTLDVDGASAEIVGVVPGSFRFPDRDTTIWLPLAPALGNFQDSRGVHGVLIVGRLAEGVEIGAAQSEMESIAARLAREYPGDNEGRGARLEPLLHAFVGETSPTLMVLMLSVGLILLIACADVAGLLMARGVDRRKELSVRASMGASRSRLVMQILTENLVLALLGGAVGIGLAGAVIRGLRALLPETFPRIGNIELDPAVMVTALLISLLSALLFGLLPALQVSRFSLASVMQSQGRGFTRRRTLSRNLLVSGEIALAVVLVTGALLLARALNQTLEVDPGFDPENLVSLDVSLPQSRYPEPAREDYPHWPQVSSFYPRVLERVSAIPGVESASIAINHPYKRGWTSQARVEGQPQPPGPTEETRMRMVTEGYFRTAGIPVLLGRPIEASDVDGQPPVVVVNQAFVDRYLPHEDPLVHSVIFWGSPRRIVGVVGNVQFAGLGEPVQPAIYPSLRQLPMSEFSVLVRSKAPVASLTRSVQEAIWSVDPDLAFFNVGPIEDVVHQAAATPRVRVVVMLVFAGSAGLLAILGLYSLVAWDVRQSRKDIGIRMALGARREQIVASAVRSALTLAGMGLAVGLAGSIAANRLLRSFLFGMSTTDPVTYGVVVGMVFGFAIVASWLPARRAAGVDPATILRTE